MRNYPQEEPLVGSSARKQYKYKENDPEYKGEPMSEDLTSGVIQNRGCTDLLFFVIFIAFWVGMIFIAIMAFKTGQPNRLASPYDTDGNHCGYDSGFEDYKNIYFVNPTTSLKNYVCVSECPGKNSTSLNCHKNSVVESCGNGSDRALVYESSKFLTICVPTDVSIWNKIKESVDLDGITQGLHDVEATWILLLTSAIFAFVFGMFLMIMMKCCAPLLIWGIILCYLGTLVLGGFIFYFKSTGTYEINSLDFINNQLSNNENTLMGIAIALWVIAGVSVIFIACLFSQIRLAIAVMEEASNYIRDVISAFFVPILMFFVSIAFLSFWFFVTLYLYSSGEITKRGETPFGHVAWDTTIKKMLAYYIIAIIWNIEFMIAFTQLVLAFSVASWYFAPGSPKHLSNNIGKSFWCAFRYHIGSVALGSFVLTLIWILKIVIEATYRQMKNVSQNQGGTCINFCFKCVNCCLDCFERFIRYLNMKAFIHIAITGEGFCTSAYNSFYMVLRNPGRFAALDTVGNIVLFFGKVFIASLTGLVCYIMMMKIDSFKNEIYSPIVPTIFFVVIAYVIGSFFMSVYGIAADTILQSFCIDEEVHKTHKGINAQYCPDTLKEFMEKNA